MRCWAMASRIFSSSPRRAAVACSLFSNAIGGGIDQALEDLSDAAADLSGVLAMTRHLSHCNAELQANLKRAGGA